MPACSELKGHAITTCTVVLDLNGVSMKNFNLTTKRLLTAITKIDQVPWRRRRAAWLSPCLPLAVLTRRRVPNSAGRARDASQHRRHLGSSLQGSGQPGGAAAPPTCMAPTACVCARAGLLPRAPGHHVHHQHADDLHGHLVGRQPAARGAHAQENHGARVRAARSLLVRPHACPWATPPTSAQQPLESRERPRRLPATTALFPWTSPPPWLAA